MAKVREVLYECGCEASGDIIDSKCPVHRKTILYDSGDEKTEGDTN